MVEYLRSIEPTLAMPVRTVGSSDQLVWRPIELAFREPDRRFLITPVRFASQMKAHRVGDGVVVDVTATPAVYYSRGTLQETQRLSSTALCADWTYLDEAGKTVDMPADFVRWARKVMQWVRRVAPGWYRYKSQRITPKAERARQAGLELIL